MKPIGKIAASAMFLIMTAGLSCTVEKSDLSKENLIPRPVSVTATGNYFTLQKGSGIYLQGNSEELQHIGNYLAARLKPATGFELAVKTAGSEAPQGNIYLSLDPKDSKNGNEEYTLEITKATVKLTASSAEGLFRGVQTFRQLFPAKIELATTQEGPWKIASGTIIDSPEYAYRGFMLDVARHFFGVDDVKRLLDELAYYKINMFHFHLADDQGWRIEIKSWPQLTLHGGLTEVGGDKGGFYTQEQYSNIVKYAAERYITVIPEIDMPGHTNAALSSYHELNCNGKAPDLYTGIEVGFSTLCTSKELTYKFIDDVVGELAALTPGPYLHIGGDESHATKIEDYIPFVKRVQDIVLSHGKKAIGWDDIAISEMKPGVYAQHWASVKNAQLAVKQGSKILMSPAVKAYVDMQYDSTTTPGLHWAAYIEVDSAYNWDPAKLIPGVAKENILGVEAALWSETIKTMSDIEYMVFPRLPGYAEIGWSPASSRSWDEYKLRLAAHGEKFKALGINYYHSPRVPWAGVKK